MKMTTLENRGEQSSPRGLWPMGAWGWVKRMTLGSATEGETVRGGYTVTCAGGPGVGCHQRGRGTERLLSALPQHFHEGQQFTRPRPEEAGVS